MATDNNKRLQELGGSDFEMADGQPDIRGWDVRDENGRRIGEVDELIFDTQSLKVRYIVLDMEDNELDLDDHNVLVPIGLAQLHKEDDDVILPNITAEQLRALPEYDDDDNLAADLETRVSNVFGRGSNTTSGSASLRDEDFYTHEHFDDNNLYRGRQGSTGTNISDADDATRRGLRLRNRMNENDVAGSSYLGSEGMDPENPYTANTGHGFTDNRIEDETTVPVNRHSLDDAEELRLDRDADNMDNNLDNRDDESTRRNRTRGQDSDSLI